MDVEAEFHRRYREEIGAAARAVPRFRGLSEREVSRASGWVPTHWSALQAFGLGLAAPSKGDPMPGFGAAGEPGRPGADGAPPPPSPDVMPGLGGRPTVDAESLFTKICCEEAVERATRRAIGLCQTCSGTPIAFRREETESGECHFYHGCEGTSMCHPDNIDRSAGEYRCPEQCEKPTWDRCGDFRALNCPADPCAIVVPLGRVPASTTIPPISFTPSAAGIDESAARALVERAWSILDANVALAELAMCIVRGPEYAATFKSHMNGIRKLIITDIPDSSPDRKTRGLYGIMGLELDSPWLGKLARQYGERRKDLARTPGGMGSRQEPGDCFAMEVADTLAHEVTHSYPGAAFDHVGENIDEECTASQRMARLFVQMLRRALGLSPCI